MGRFVDDLLMVSIGMKTGLRTLKSELTKHFVINFSEGVGKFIGAGSRLVTEKGIAMHLSHYVNN